jgi:hypothetical protein
MRGCIEGCASLKRGSGASTRIPEIVFITIGQQSDLDTRTH